MDKLSEPSTSKAEPGVAVQLVKSLSCLNCRLFKTKCWPDIESPEAPCLRCQRLALTCERVAKRRGRKRKQEDIHSEAIVPVSSSNDIVDQQDSPLKKVGDITVPVQTSQPQNALAPAATSSVPSNFFTIPADPQGSTSQNIISSQPLFTFAPSVPAHNDFQPSNSQFTGFSFTNSQQQQPNNGFQPSNTTSNTQFTSFLPSNPPQFSAANDPIVHFASPALPSPASTNTSGNMAQVGEAPTDPSGNATSIFQGFTSKGHSLAEGLELVSAAAGHVSSLEIALANSFQDPIACGIVSDSEADELVKYYFAHLQDCICLLDPELHTTGYMRQNTLILLTAVLAVAAKFTKEKHLHARLFAMADSAIKTAIFQPLYELQVIQAICILVYWKDATDDSGWLRLGHACRLGFKLGLHNLSMVLPEDAMEARKAMDRQRTWICLYCTDNHHSETHTLPPSIQPEHLPNIDTWLSRNTVYHLPSDGQLAYVVGVLTAKSTYASISANVKDPVLVRSMLEAAARNIRNHNSIWTGDNPPLPLAPLSRAIIKFYSQCREVIIEETAMRIAEPKDHEIQLGHCVNALLSLMDIILEDFQTTGYLRTMQDLIIVAIASAAVRLGRCLPSVQHDIRALIRMKLAKVKAACSEAAQKDSSSTAAYISRFIARLLGKLSTGAFPFASRTASPAPSGLHLSETVAEQQTGEEENLLADLDFYLANPETAPNEIDDSIFWSLTAPNMMSSVDHMLGGGEFDSVASLANLNFPMPPFNFDPSFTAQFPWPDFLSVQEPV